MSSAASPAGRPREPDPPICDYCDFEILDEDLPIDERQPCTARDEGYCLSREDRELLDELVEVLDRPRLDVDKAELLEDPAQYKKSALPRGKVPGFGEPDEDCGKVIPESMHYCSSCYDPAEIPHNCYRYDCPMHGLHAVRRRAAGCSSMPGASGRLGALRAILDSRSSRDHFVYHHASLNLPTEFYFKSDDLLKRGRNLCREFMDVFDAQGWVIYHPWKTEEGEDGKGFWKTVLGHGLEWDSVREDIEYHPHFHLVIAAPKGGLPGGAVTRDLESRTGVVFERHTQRGSNVSAFEDKDIARALTYALSHAMVYSKPESRPLAAWFKGPDVGDVDVREPYKSEHRGHVYDVSEKVLGLEAGELECENEFPTSESEDGDWSPSPARSGGNTADLLSRTRGDEFTLDVPESSSTQVETERCGGQLRHISQAGEVLPELVKRGADVDDLDRAYRSYVDVMKAKGLEPEDGRPDVPEHGDRPPP